MKNIKNLGITTKEGFEVKNLQRFPSMEWGDEGGMQADVYFKGNHVMQVFQEGNGGCAITYPTEYFKTHRFAVERECLKFLKRIDNDYGPDSPYEWLKNKKVAVCDISKPREDLINDDDWEALVNNIEEYYDDVKSASNSFKAGFLAVACLKNNFETAFLQFRVADVTDDEVRVFLKKKGLETKYPEFRILSNTPDLHVL